VLDRGYANLREHPTKLFGKGNYPLTARTFIFEEAFSRILHLHNALALSSCQSRVVRTHRGGPFASALRFTKKIRFGVQYGALINLLLPAMISIGTRDHCRILALVHPTAS
jgi:hypothetical protein